MTRTRLILRALVACLACSPLLAAAAWVCTDAAGHTSFQDRPCEGKPPSRNWAPVKASELTTAGAKETMRRFDAALNERDMVAAGALLASNFTTLFPERDRLVPLGRAEFMNRYTRVVQASKIYRSEHLCQEGVADPGTRTLKLDCRNAESIDILHRAKSTDTRELVRIGLEAGELKIVEISNTPPPDAAASAGRH
jgi:hypothetical protein